MTHPVNRRVPKNAATITFSCLKLCIVIAFKPCIHSVFGGSSLAESSWYLSLQLYWLRIGKRSPHSSDNLLLVGSIARRFDEEQTTTRPKFTRHDDTRPPFVVGARNKTAINRGGDKLNLMLPEADGCAFDGQLGDGINHYARNWRCDGVAVDEAALTRYDNDNAQN